MDISKEFQKPDGVKERLCGFHIEVEKKEDLEIMEMRDSGILTATGVKGMVNDRESLEVKGRNTTTGCMIVMYCLCIYLSHPILLYVSV